MKQHTFLPEYETVGSVWPTATIEELAEYNSVYAASPEFAVRNSGPIVKRILDKIPEWWWQECRDRGLLPNIDVRVHRLYKGSYPAFPGWHCDAELRETYFGQPDLDRTPISKTVTCTVSTLPGGLSNTEFLAEPITVSINVGESDEMLWGQVHRQVGDRQTWRMPDGAIVSFSHHALHRAMPAISRGWRLFFRMSMWHKPYLGVEGKISRQEQIYRLVEGSGW